MTISSLYHKHPHTVRENALVSEVIASLVTNKINSIIVLDDHNAITGIISVEDIVRAIVPEEFKENASVAVAMYKHNFFNESCAAVAELTAHQIMRREFITATPDSHIMAIAAAFLKNDLFIVPIVKDDTLVGVITRSQIAHAIAESLPLPIATA